MNKFYMFCTLITLLVLGCGKSGDDFKLETGTPTFEFATKLSTTLPYLDPVENNVIVSTNKFNITSGEVIYNIKKNMGNRSAQLSDLAETQLKDNIDRFANILGERRLLLLEAKKSNIATTDSQIDSVLNLQYQRMGGKEKFDSFLETNGQSIEDVKNDIKDGLTIQSYIREVQAGVTVSEEEIQNAYNVNTVTVRHILLSTKGKKDSEKQQIKEKMEEILTKAKSGENFADLAKQYSEDPGSKTKGGLYENVQRGQMVKPFDEAAFSVPVGEISDIIETQFGYHILTVLEQKKETKPLEEVRQALENNLKQQKSNEAFQKHLDDLKTQYEYEVVQF